MQKRTITRLTNDSTTLAKKTSNFLTYPAPLVITKYPQEALLRCKSKSKVIKSKLIVLIIFFFCSPIRFADGPVPNVTWLRDRGERKEPISSPKARTFVESGIYTLGLPEATESEAGTYVCRVSNEYGHIDTSATVEVIPLSKFDDLGKPAMFISRPSQKLVQVIDGEMVSISFRISGTPKPRSESYLQIFHI